jgi:hypothetical protein
MMDTDDDRDVGPAEHLHDNRSSQLAAHGHHVQYGFKLYFTITNTHAGQI